MATIQFEEECNYWANDMPLPPVNSTIMYKTNEFIVVNHIIFYFDDDLPQIHIICKLKDDDSSLVTCPKCDKDFSIDLSKYIDKSLVTCPKCKTEYAICLMERDTTGRRLHPSLGGKLPEWCE